MELGQRLKQARLEAGMSQRQLCGDTITRNMLSQIENGTARPSMATLRFLAAQLGKPVSYFLEETVASGNQPRITAARAAYAQGELEAAEAALSDYAGPDPIFDAEYHLLQALLLLNRAERCDDRATVAGLLSRCADAGKQTPYYTPELERRRLLCLGRVTPEAAAAIADALPGDDRELLLRARAALTQGDSGRCVCLLSAARDTATPDWLLLRADAALSAGDDTTAEACLRQAEAAVPQQAWPRLEQLYLRQENYRQAYYYATRQRQEHK